MGGSSVYGAFCKFTLRYEVERSQHKSPYNINMCMS